MSKCTFCENLCLKTLLSRLDVFERESSVFPRRAPGMGMWSARRWRASRRASPFLSLSHLSTCARVRRLNSLTITYILARRHTTTVSFGLDDVLFTAASDSEDFGPALTDSLPTSGQEAWPSAAYSELVDVLSRATEKPSIDWPDEPRESQSPKLDERFLSGPNSRPGWRKLPFFSDLQILETAFFLPPH